MAMPNYGRERPTPPHVVAHDNPHPKVSAVFIGGEMAKLRAANAGKTSDQIQNNTASATGTTPPQKQRYNHR